MNIKSFNFVISIILLIKYSVRADGDLETLDASGKKCSTKLSLCELDPTKITSLGLKGDKGDIGPRGETGTCTCGGGTSLSTKSVDDEGVPGETDDADLEPEWGTYDNPGNTTCRNAPIDKTDIYYLYNSIRVKCDVHKGTTCVQISDNPVDVSISEMKPSWFSSAVFDFNVLENLYSLSNTQLAWLQARSDTASMRIRYHCVNTNPTRKDKPLLLLSWKDSIIGREPSASSPFQYEVENNGCAEARRDFWSFTDIVIKNTTANRLPIIDFYIQDVEKEQQHKITVTELCFY